ncbi:MAG: Flp family type IVb pilin [Pseudolabrys sp.]|nr:Flp family type IVb pilin [Pseudolabrys sp.]
MRAYNLTGTVRRFLAAADGATSIEYALIASGVSIAILSMVTTLGETIQTIFYDKLTNLF